MMRRRASPSARTTRIRADGVPRPGRPRRRSRASRRSHRTRGQSPGTAPARAWKVDRSVAQGGPPDPRPSPWPDPRTGALGCPRSPSACCWRSSRWRSTWLTRTDRYYDHFVWQAAAFLEGHAAIRYPVEAQRRRCTATPTSRTSCRSSTGDGVAARACCPFPPLPALVLLPFVAALGARHRRPGDLHDPGRPRRGALLVDARAPARSRPAIRLGDDASSSPSGRSSGTRPSSATTWYQAHIVAVGLTLLAVGIAIGADPARRRRARRRIRRRARRGRGRPSEPAAAASAVDRRQFLAGAALRARLHRAPDGRLRRAVLRARRRRRRVGGGAAGRPASGRHSRCWLLLVYNVATTGQRLPSRATTTCTRVEANGYPTLGYHPDWSVEDARYIPQNLGIVLLGRPTCLPRPCRTAWRSNRPWSAPSRGPSAGLFDADCPLALPRDIGMSVLLTSPAYLLALPVLRRFGASRLVTGAVLAVIVISVVNLMHFSQGWVQFGYRFSNDVAPFALLLVALGADGWRADSLGAGAGGWPARRLGRDQPVGRGLEPHARMVSRDAGRCRAARCWWLASRSSPRARRCLPGSRSGTPPSCRRSARSWARPTRPASRPTPCSAGSPPSSCSRSASRRSG